MTDPQSPAAPDRRRLLKQGGSLALLLSTAQIARGASIVAVRLWPAEDYTRVTIESDTALKASHHMIGSPPRLAVDIDGLHVVVATRLHAHHARVGGRVQQLHEALNQRGVGGHVLGMHGAMLVAWSIRRWAGGCRRAR